MECRWNVGCSCQTAILSSASVRCAISGQSAVKFNLLWDLKTLATSKCLFPEECFDDMFPHMITLDLLVTNVTLSYVRREN